MVSFPERMGGHGTQLRRSETFKPPALPMVSGGEGGQQQQVENPFHYGIISRCERCQRRNNLQFVEIVSDSGGSQGQYSEVDSMESDPESGEL